MQVLRIAHRAGLLHLGQVALDGTTLRADVSRHKAVSYARDPPGERGLQIELEEPRRQVRVQLDNPNG